MSKYNNRKICINGINFDSKKEARRYIALVDMQEHGQISNLQTQVKYVLIPAQREVSNEIYTKGQKKGCLKPGKVLERECAYIADFVYFDSRTGKTVVEDTKGFRTKDYAIKRKLMLYVHCIRIKEI